VEAKPESCSGVVGEQRDGNTCLLKVWSQEMSEVGKERMGRWATNREGDKIASSSQKRPTNAKRRCESLLSISSKATGGTV